MTDQKWFTVLFAVFMVFVAIQRIVETRSRRPKIQGNRLLQLSFPILMGVHVAVFVGSVVEYFVASKPVIYWVSCLGFVLYGISVVLRNVAIRALGRYFSLHIEIREQHKLVTDGVYGWVRHPIYVAVIMELVSVPLAGNAWWSLAGALFVYVPLLMWRLRHEEIAMVAGLGDAYRNYQKNVGALMPKLSRLFGQ